MDSRPAVRIAPYMNTETTTYAPGPPDAAPDPAAGFSGTYDRRNVARAALNTAEAAEHAAFVASLPLTTGSRGPPRRT